MAFTDSEESDDTVGCGCGCGCTCCGRRQGARRGSQLPRGNDFRSGARRFRHCQQPTVKVAVQVCVHAVNALLNVALRVLLAIVVIVCVVQYFDLFIAPASEDKKSEQTVQIPGSITLLPSPEAEYPANLKEGKTQNSVGFVEAEKEAEFEDAYPLHLLC